MDELQDLGDSQFPLSAPATVLAPPAPKTSSTSLTKAVNYRSIITKKRKAVPCVRKNFPEFPKGFPKFYKRLYELLNDPSTDSFILWSKSNRSFYINKPEELVLRQILCRFHCTTPKQFIRMLKHYGFKQDQRSGKNIWKFRNQNFVRGKPERMVEMHKRVMIKKTLEIRSREKNAKAEVELLDRLQNLRI